MSPVEAHQINQANHRDLADRIKVFNRVDVSRNEPAHRYKSITSQQSVELTNMLIPSTPEFSDIETGELFTAVVNPQNPFDSGFQQYRNYLIHRLMFNYGLRVGEVQLEKYKAKFEERLVAYNAVGQLEWNAGSWHFGEKGVAWLKETKDRGFKWDEVSSRVKGLSQMNISSEFQDFMRAYHMHLVCITGGLPSGSTLDKPLQVMKRWYWEMVNKTSQTHPMYLTSDIIHAAMERHHENSDSPDNVSDYCDIAVKAIDLLRQYDLFLVNIEVKNKFPYRNGSNSTKERKKAQEATPDQTDDERLISIRAFMCVIELIALAENSYQRIFYNMLLLTIICGFRFQEIMLLKMTSLVKREITDKEKRQHAIDQDWPSYRLGIEYLGAKKAGWRIHWLAPSTYSVVEMIYKSVQELTSGFRKTIQGFRDSNFTNMLPGKIADFPDEWR
nr:hypothetical protein [Providencia rettgeri]